MTDTQKIEFKAEVAKVLDIVIHSLYSNKEIFLRELISNASDACDKLRYEQMLHPDLAKSEPFKIRVELNKTLKTLTVADNGIGMNREDLINHLGTIARSGSSEFVQSLSGDKQKDMALIGQFGVGFYASFMVASKVQVYSRKAGETQGWRWESDGAGSFEVSEAADVSQGTRVTLFLREDAEEYLDPFRVRQLIKQYSDFVNVPIALCNEGKEDVVNAGSALWMRSKSEITETQYKDFYQAVAHALDTPWETLHFHAEGVIDYTALVFVPTKPPVNLFQPDRPSALSLYVNKVFISSDVPELLPYWLRFVTGVIDTKDLPLNVSREMLQQTPVMAKIKQGLSTKILNALKKRAENPQEYQVFWDAFGIVLKEGLYEPSAQRDEVAELCRFYSTNGDGVVSLADYVGRMKNGQDSIYYLTGSDLATLRQNPQLEGFMARGIEVLLLTDPIDEFWTNTYPEYQGKKFVSVQQAGDELDKIQKVDLSTEAVPQPQMDALIEKMKAVLGDQVKAIQVTDRLTKSPMALVTGAGQMTLNMERLMRAHGQQTVFASDRILQLNPHHPVIAKMAQMEDPTDYILVLFNQTLVIEGEPIKDPALWTEKLMALLLK